VHSLSFISQTRPRINEEMRMKNSKTKIILETLLFMIKFMGGAPLEIGDYIYQNTNCDENEGEDVSAAQDPEIFFAISLPNNGNVDNCMFGKEFNFSRLAASVNKSMGNNTKKDDIENVSNKEIELILTPASGNHSNIGRYYP
jgi:hypothetical protein